MRRAVVVVSLVAAILLFLWFAPAAVFDVAVAIAAVLATHELYAMFDVANGQRFLYAIGLLAAVGLVAQMALLPAATLGVSVALFVMFVLTIVAFTTKRPGPTELLQALVVILGVLYVPLMLGQVVWIRASEHGREWVAIIVATIFTREISAHFAGKLLPAGKPLNAHINQYKSYTGAIAGAAAAAVAALCASRYFNVGATAAGALVFGACVGLACQLGDFAESYLKRVAGVRHSGTILGPEGGVLDFLDAASFAILTARLLLFAMRRLQ